MDIINALVNALLLVTVCAFVSAAIGFYNQIIIDRYRFRYFALRDRLSCLVVKGRLAENSWEYQCIVDVLNFHIKTVETMSIRKIVETLADFHTSDDEQRNVKKMKTADIDKEVLEVLSAFFHTTSSLLRRNSRVEIAILNFLERLNFLSNDSFKNSVVLSRPRNALWRLEEAEEKFTACRA